MPTPREIAGQVSARYKELKGKGVKVDFPSLVIEVVRGNGYEGEMTSIVAKEIKDLFRKKHLSWLKSHRPIRG